MVLNDIYFSIEKSRIPTTFILTMNIGTAASFTNTLQTVYCYMIIIWSILLATSANGWKLPKEIHCSISWETPNRDRQHMYFFNRHRSCCYVRYYVKLFGKLPTLLQIRNDSWLLNVSRIFRHMHRLWLVNKQRYFNATNSPLLPMYKRYEYQLYSGCC